MPANLLTTMIEANLAAAAAIALILLLRKPIRQRLGAHAAYALWALVPVAMLATLIPARTAEAIVTQPNSAGAIVVEFNDPAQQIITPHLTLTDALPWIWAAGALALFAWMAIGQIRFLRAMKTGRAGPAIVGVLRPRIVTPANFSTHYSQPERDLILAHETAHLARHDSRINALAALMRCAFWFNPFIHFGAHAMRIDQELSCDAAVIARRPGGRRAYAQALLKTQLAACPLPLGCYWPAGTQHPLTERIAMLNLPPPTARRRFAAAALITAATAATGLTAWAFQPERPAPAIERPTIANGVSGQPDYPAESIRLHEEGDTALKMCITPTGAAENIELLSSSGHQRLDDATLAFVRTLPFKPAMQDGNPVRLCDHIIVWRWSIPDGFAPIDASGPNPQPIPEPAPQPQPQQSDEYTDFTGRTYDSESPVLLRGPLTQFQNDDKGFLVHITDKESGTDWIVSGGDPGHTADVDQISKMLQTKVGTNATIRGYASTESCTDTCFANGRDITFNEE